MTEILIEFSISVKVDSYLVMIGRISLNSIDSDRYLDSLP